MNWALYTEWINQEQQQQKKGMLEVLSDDEVDVEPTCEQEGDQHPSSICIEVVLNELLCYLEFSNKLATGLEENECLNMQTKEEIKTMSMKD
jgi:hypothetical protein